MMKCENPNSLKQQIKFSKKTKKSCKKTLITSSLQGFKAEKS